MATHVFRRLSILGFPLKCTNTFCSELSDFSISVILFDGSPEGTAVLLGQPSCSARNKPDNQICHPKLGKKKKKSTSFLTGKGTLKKGRPGGANLLVPRHEWKQQSSA